MWGRSQFFSAFFHRSCILLLRGSIEHVQPLDRNSQHKGFPDLSLQNSEIYRSWSMVIAFQSEFLETTSFEAVWTSSNSNVVRCLVNTSSFQNGSGRWDGTLVLARHVPLFIMAPTVIIATKRGSCSIIHQTGAPSTPDGLYRPCLLPARPGQRQIVEGLRMRRSLLSSFIVGAGLDYNVYIFEWPEFGWPQNREVSDRTAGKTTSVWNFCAGVVLLYRTLCWSCMQGERAKDVHVLVVRMDVQFLRTKGPLSCTKDSDASDRRTKKSSASNG